VAGVRPLDRQHLLEQLAERLRRRGFPHPDAAAVALAARARSGQDRPAFACHLGLAEGHLARIEAGEVPLDELPEQLRSPPDGHP
jgi:hypothetical protein